MDLEKKFRHVLDFPKKGIDFIDITTVLNDKDAFKDAVEKLAEAASKSKCDVIVGSEARGFILGAAVAYKMGVRFVPVRKKGKLPYKTISGTYDLEYGTDTLEMHIDAIKENDNVVIVDDLLATGGTALCITDMIKELKGNIVSSVFLVELKDLPGRNALEKAGIDVLSVVKI